MSALVVTSRRSLLRRIKRALGQRLRPSGYRVGPVGSSRPYLVAPLKSSRRLGGLIIDEYEGFSEDGVVNEFGVGCVTTPWRAIPIEDLERVLRVVESKATRWRGQP